MKYKWSQIFSMYSTYTIRMWCKRINSLFWLKNIFLEWIEKGHKSITWNSENLYGEPEDYFEGH